LRKQYVCATASPAVRYVETANIIENPDYTRTWPLESIYTISRKFGVPGIFSVNFCNKSSFILKQIEILR